jgi:hypothetical protein
MSGSFSLAWREILVLELAGFTKDLRLPYAFLRAARLVSSYEQHSGGCRSSCSLRFGIGLLGLCFRSILEKVNTPRASLGKEDQGVSNQHAVTCPFKREFCGTK